MSRSLTKEGLPSSDVVVLTNAEALDTSHTHQTSMIVFEDDESIRGREAPTSDRHQLKRSDKHVFRVM